MFKNKKYYGTDAQKRMQLGFALSSLIVLVGVPTWFEYCMGYNKRRLDKQSLLPNYQSPQSNAYRARIRERLLAVKLTTPMKGSEIEKL